METEIWKAHPDIVWIEVSTLGRVRTLDKMVWNGRGTRLIKGRTLKQIYNRGYLQVFFRVNGKVVGKYVHRLIAEAFIPNPDSLPQINHKDCNRANNDVSNLEWCTASYNAKYRNKFGVSNVETQGCPLFAVNLATLKFSHFRAQAEAGRKLEIGVVNINMVIKGKTKQAGGYWFVNDDENADEAIKNKLHDIRNGEQLWQR